MDIHYNIMLYCSEVKNSQIQRSKRFNQVMARHYNITLYCSRGGIGKFKNCQSVLNEKKLLVGLKLLLHSNMKASFFDILER